MKPKTTKTAYEICDILKHGEKTIRALAEILKISAHNVRYTLQYLIENKYVIKNDDSNIIVYRRTDKVMERPDGVEDYIPPAPSNIRVFMNSNKRVQVHKSQKYSGGSGFRGSSSLVGFDSW